jgi:hypothetical protein
MKRPEFIRSKSNLFRIITVAAFLFLIFIHGLLPELATRLNYADYGSIDCGSQHLSGLFHAKCYDTGGPAGHAIVTGLPTTFVGALLHKVLALSAMWSFSIVGMTVMAISMWGVYRLLRATNVGRWLALVGSVTYLLAPIILSMHNFNGTYWGVLLLPAAIYTFWMMLQYSLGNKCYDALLSFGFSLLVNLTLLFEDGYSFTMFSVAALLMLVTWSWMRWREAKIWLTIAAYVLSVAIAYKVYKHIIPAAGSWTDSILLFRAMGLDVVTLFVPGANLWFSQVLGFHTSLPSHLWGDGTNSSSNYVGIFLITGAAAGLYKLGKNITRLTVALLLIGCASFLLSLGPALKIDSQRPTNLGKIVTHASYLMPSSASVAPLPSVYVYKNVPGFKAMRATYRWHVLTVLVLVIFAFGFLQFLFERGQRRLALALAALLLLNFMPNPFRTLRTQSAIRNEVHGLQGDVIKPLGKKIRPGTHIVYFPNSLGNNDFLANYITPEIKAWSYNIGGDKALAIALGKMPKPVTDLIIKGDSGGQISKDSGRQMASLLRQGYVHAIVIPRFDLRWDSYTWPPNDPGAIQRADQAVSLARAAGLSIYTSNDFYIATLPKTAD